MNNTEMMETLAIQTNEDAMTIESILKSYEHYCNENITRYSSKHLAAIIDLSLLKLICQKKPAQK